MKYAILFEIFTIIYFFIIKDFFMDDSPVSESKEATLPADEVDPLDAYMLEIDEQVHELDERDKLLQNTMKNSVIDSKKDKNNIKLPNLSNERLNEVNNEEDEGEDSDEDDTVGKAGKFATVEELIA